MSNREQITDVDAGPPSTPSMQDLTTSKLITQLQATAY
jgi:hypothetical protein